MSRITRNQLGFSLMEMYCREIKLKLKTTSNICKTYFISYIYIYESKYYPIFGRASWSYR